MRFVLPYPAIIADSLNNFAQIDELINVGSSAAFQNNHSAEDQQSEETKGPAAGNSRMLKIFMTDGIQQVS